MQIKLIECMYNNMKDTILPQIAKSETIKDLVQKINCSDLFIYYKDKSNKEHMFKIYLEGQYLSQEYEKFLNCDKLPAIKLLDDFHDILIQYSGFGNECYLHVIAR